MLVGERLLVDVLEGDEGAAVVVNKLPSSQELSGVLEGDVRVTTLTSQRLLGPDLEVVKHPTEG